MIKKLAFLTLFSLLAGCASTPDFDVAQVDTSLTPRSVIAEPESHHSKTALWGGMILNTENLKDITRIEILAYPLNTSHRPLLERKPLGRFIIQHQGFLEPATFAQGRVVSVLGKISDIETGYVNGSIYTYAVINSEQLHLWSQDDRRDRTRFHIGIGIGL